jgi:hypothetical protein
VTDPVVDGTIIGQETVDDDTIDGAAAWVAAWGS